MGFGSGVGQILPFPIAVKKTATNDYSRRLYSNGEVF